MSKAIMEHNHFIQTLPSGALDIVGDVHGEWLVLQQLVRHLGYDERGEHPQGRRLVFIGDICDRGPDSPSALAWVLRARREHGALCVLGNHEVNLLAADPKDGSAWFFDSRIAQDRQYEPYRRLPQEQHAALLAELAELPLILARNDVRLVHAAWLPDSVAKLRTLSPERSVAQWYRYFDEHVHDLVRDKAWYADYVREFAQYNDVLDNADLNPPLLPAHAEFELSRWRENPVRALVSGSEKHVAQPFYAGARWRFTGRAAWWDDYHDDVPVVVGHYWRLWNAPKHGSARYEALMPNDGTAWFGAQNNVYCVDFSVGARWRDRQAGIAAAQSKFHLAALRWPECRVMLEDGSEYETTAFQTS